MFAERDRRQGSRFSVEVAFTDRWGGVSSGQYATLDLTLRRGDADEELAVNRARLAESFGVAGFAVMRQVHGADVAYVDSIDAATPTCDALVTSRPDVALCVRVGDCLPLVLADVDAGVIAVAHVGRPGIVAGVVESVMRAMVDRGADQIRGWLGPHVCSGCYEVPSAMRDDVAAIEPAAFSCTTWGTPSVDIGSAVVAQLRLVGCLDVHESRLCTRESEDLFSYRRQGPASGRLGGLVVLRETSSQRVST
jgi:hypothetical protein